MRHATLIANPAAGRARELRTALPAIAAHLLAAGYALAVLETTPEPGSGNRLARSATASSDLILAAGGDGTIHDVIQGVALSGVSLGVLPLGTHNALARNLGLLLSPLAALQRLLTYTPTVIPLGQAEAVTGSRFFITMAGCGPDGALIASLPPRLKARLGRAAYYTHAARLFLTRRWPAFRVRYRLQDAPAWHQTEAVALLAARVADLGGVFSGLAGRASLNQALLQVQLLRAPAQLALPAWFASARIGSGNPWLSTLKVDELTCEPIQPRLITHAQADAELLGPLPVTLRLVPAALHLLMPPAGQP